MISHEKLLTNIDKTQSLLCVGLDPRITIDENIPIEDQKIFEKITAQNERIIDATFAQCACYKPNIAFYEQWGIEGLRALEWTISHIPDSSFIILDAKRGDIGATSEAYAHAAFSYLGVDSITLSPYMGKESIAPFVQEDKLLFVLIRTSNPSADDIQLLSVSNQPVSSSSDDKAMNKLYVEVARQFADMGTPKIGFVVGANCLEELSLLRSLYPTTWILAPGIGVQGGNISQAIQAGIGKDNNYLLPVVSRAIAQASNPEEACKELNIQIQKSLPQSAQVFNSSPLSEKPSSPSQDKYILTDLQKLIIKKLFEYECVKTGSFILKSGIESPFYIDLRRVISFPDLFELVTEAYCMTIQTLNYHCIAGIPTAALPLAAAVARTLKKPMIYPRIPKKAHGSGNAIEGMYQANETALLLDDLITKGSSKVEALEILHDAQIITTDIVVLICRSNNAIEDMKNLGVSLHYALHIDEILWYAHQEGLISDDILQKIHAFLDSTSN